MFNEPIQDNSVVAALDEYTGGGKFRKVSDTEYYIDYWINITLNFEFKDLAGNTGTNVIKVTNIDKEAPQLNVNDTQKVYVFDYDKSTYVERGASANDNVDGIIDVIISGEINGKVAGLHLITYTATDTAGNRAIYEREIYIRPLITAPENFNHELGEDFTIPKAQLKLSEDEIIDLEPTFTSVRNFNKDKIGEYRLDYQHTMTTSHSDISALGKNTFVTVIDTKKPLISFGEPFYTDKKYFCLPIVGCTLISSVVNIEVNVTDKGNIKELKYIWSPFNEEPKQSWWKHANDFENGQSIPKKLLGDGLLNWDLWIYAKDESGNWDVAFSNIHGDE
jgi:hypothetical protein